MMAFLLIWAVVTQDELPMLTVAPFQSQALGREACRALDSLLVDALEAQNTYRVMSLRDVNALLGVERARDLVGCDQVSCMSEITAALGAPFMIYGEVQEVAGRLRYSLTLLDMRANRVLRRAAVDYTDDAFFFPYAMTDAVRELFALHRPVSGVGSEAQVASLARRKARHPLPPRSSEADSPAFVLRVLGLEEATGRRFSAPERQVLRLCDELEKEMVATVWTAATLLRREQLAGQIRGLRATLSASGPFDVRHWPPADSCF